MPEPQKMLEQLAAQGIEWLVKTSWGIVGINEYKGFCFVHCRIWDWGKQHRKDCALHWELVKNEARLRGYKLLLAGCPAEDRKGYKFRQLFGFVEDQRIPAIGQILMKQEI